MNKPAGTPCVHLQPDHRCNIHSQLRENGFKGCTVFDCLGAGQVVSQITFSGKDWREHPKIGERMFQVFPIMEQIHEMIAYVSEALSYNIPKDLADSLFNHLKTLQAFTKLDVDHLLALDLVSIRFPLNECLTTTSDFIRENFIRNKPGMRKNEALHQARVDWAGKNLKGKDLSGTDFRGAFLIAANMSKTDLRAVNFIGADLRDVNFSGANLSTSLFLNQMQMNSAKGDLHTILPSHIQRPAHWQN